MPPGRSLRARRSARLVVAALLWTACAAPGRQLDPFSSAGARATSMRVEVRNNNFNDATIYYSQLGGTERRVGDVVGNGRRTFDVPLEFTGDVRFRIELLAAGWCTLYPIVVSPGDVIGIDIVSDFPGAANCENAGRE
ncbi:MAG: hypothetical protein AB7T31_07665 [Gemmatimonadales bacterium]